MYNFKYLIGGAALMLASSALAGGPDEAPAPINNSGFYVNANGGWALLADASPYQTSGWNIGAAVGYRFNNFRAELAGNYFNHGVFADSTSFLFLTPGIISARPLQFWNLMVNGYYDFDLGNNFVPYVGAGLGWAHAYQRISLTPAAAATATLTVNDTQNLFAFQGILGVDYKISDSVRIGLSYHALGFSGSNNTLTITRNNGTTLLATGGSLISFENQFNLELSYFF